MVMPSKKRVKTKKRRSSESAYSHFPYPDQFGNWLGYQVIKIDSKAQTSEVELLIREDHLSSAGRVHGGVVAAFLDYACGAAVFSTLRKEDFCSTVELKVNYLRPIDLGDRLVAKTQIVFRGKRLCVLHSLLFRNKDKKPVSMATSTFHIGTSKK